MRNDDFLNFNLYKREASLDEEFLTKASDPATRDKCIKKYSIIRSIHSYAIFFLVMLSSIRHWDFTGTVIVLLALSISYLRFETYIRMLKHLRQTNPGPESKKTIGAARDLQFSDLRQ